MATMKQKRTILSPIEMQTMKGIGSVLAAAVGYYGTDRRDLIWLWGILFIYGIWILYRKHRSIPRGKRSIAIGSDMIAVVLAWGLPRWTAVSLSLRGRLFLDVLVVYGLSLSVLYLYLITDRNRS